MKTVGYREGVWNFLDDYRGKEFEGEWPTVPQLFHISELRFPNNLCFQAFDPEEKYTYKEAANVIRAVARKLVADGFMPGDKIAVSGYNSCRWVIAYFAVLWMGGIIVPLDSSLKDLEMEHFITFGSVKGIFLTDERIGSIDKDGRLGLKKYNLGKIEEMDGPEVPFSVRNGEDIAAILFTSGTTGIPKGVMLTHNNLVTDCLQIHTVLDMRPTDVSYAILPLHHSYTMMAVVYLTFSTGGAVVFGRKLAMSHIFRELREGKVTIFMSVPMLYNKIIAALMDGVKKKGVIVYGIVKCLMKLSGAVKHVTGKNFGKNFFGSLLQKISFENIRICISGGGPLPVSTFRMFNELGIDFVQGYGLTEASPVTHVNPIEAFRVESVGKRFPAEEVKIVNPDSDGNGVIFIKGPMVMKGYYNNPEATREVLSSDGWLNTGDVGHQDDDGYLYLTGRAKNVIVTEGGKNVFPEEVEDPFQLYNDIDQVCVIGYMADKALKKEGIRIIIVPSQAYMDSVGNDKAVIEKHMNDIVDTVNRGAASHKRITKVTVSYSPLPMTSTKKVKRSDVIELFKEV